MKNTRLITLIILFLFALNSCNSKSESKNIEGTWVSNHEPFAYVFKADGTYELLDTSPEALRETGTWLVEGDRLITTNAEKQKESRKINFVDGLLFLGDLPEFDPKCAECEYKNVSEYVKEMGLRKK